MTDDKQEAFVNKKILALAIGVLIIVLGIGAGLFFYWRSPEYCFQQAQEAVQTHNEKQFVRYTDLDGLCNSSYLMFQNYEASRDSELMHSRTGMMMFLQVRNLIQPEAVGAAKKTILSYVKNGQWMYGTEAGGNISRGMAEAMDIPNIQLLDVQDVDTSHSDAVVSVKVKNSILIHGFILQVGMRKQGDGTWRINRINNLKEYLAAMDKAREHTVNRAD